MDIVTKNGMNWDPKMLTKKLTFTYRNVQNTGAYILPDEADRRLFWYDWYKNYFAEKFKNQNYFTSIDNVDLSQAVIIDAKTLQLRLNPKLSSIIHIANTKDTLQFSTKISSTIALITSILLIIILCVLNYYNVIPHTIYM